jgi:hypothetical protein
VQGRIRLLERTGAISEAVALLEGAMASSRDARAANARAQRALMGLAPPGSAAAGARREGAPDARRSASTRPGGAPAAAAKPGGGGCGWTSVAKARPPPAPEHNATVALAGASAMAGSDGPCASAFGGSLPSLPRVRWAEGFDGPHREGDGLLTSAALAAALAGRGLGLAAQSPPVWAARAAAHAPATAATTADTLRLGANPVLPRDVLRAGEVVRLRDERMTVRTHTRTRTRTQRRCSRCALHAARCALCSAWPPPRACARARVLPPLCRRPRRLTPPPAARAAALSCAALPRLSLPQAMGARIAADLRVAEAQAAQRSADAAAAAAHADAAAPPAAEGAADPLAAEPPLATADEPAAVGGCDARPPSAAPAHGGMPSELAAAFAQLGRPDPYGYGMPSPRLLPPRADDAAAVAAYARELVGVRAQLPRDQTLVPAAHAKGLPSLADVIDAAIAAAARNARAAAPAASAGAIGSAAAGAAGAPAGKAGARPASGAKAAAAAKKK